jgi:hypothetical protein
LGCSSSLMIALIYLLHEGKLPTMPIGHQKYLLLTDGSVFLLQILLKGICKYRQCFFKLLRLQTKCLHTLCSMRSSRIYTLYLTPVFFPNEPPVFFSSSRIKSIPFLTNSWCFPILFPVLCRVCIEPLLKLCCDWVMIFPLLSTQANTSFSLMFGCKQSRLLFRVLHCCVW